MTKHSRFACVAYRAKDDGEHDVAEVFTNEIVGDLSVDDQLNPKFPTTSTMARPTRTSTPAKIHYIADTIAARRTGSVGIPRTRASRDPSTPTNMPEHLMYKDDMSTRRRPRNKTKRPCVWVGGVYAWRYLRVCVAEYGHRTRCFFCTVFVSCVDSQQANMDHSRAFSTVAQVARSNQIAREFDLR